MADYIYLIQNRLSPAQWRALDAVREAARAQNMPVFLVGGAVRDLTIGSPVRDLDFAVQGDVGALRPELESRGAIFTGQNGLLRSLYLTFPCGVRVEVTPSVTVTWPQPGKGEVQSASILDDLRRRDFTANAMAVSLNEGSYGLLLDPLNGMADIENRELRLVSAYGFIEQPALLLRAARLTERLGWSLEERTQSRYENSKEEGHIGALPPEDRGSEVEEILHEEDPVSVLEHMAAEGWSEQLFPALRAESADRSGLDHVRDLVGQLDAQGLHPDPSAVNFPFLTAKMKEGDRQALKTMLPRSGFVRQIEGLEARAKEFSGELTSKAAAQPSESWKLLTNADPEVVLHLAVHSRSGAAQNKIKAFLKDWPQMRQRIPYALMQEMRITPDLPVYEKLLDDLFLALLDGKLDTPEAMRAFLEPYSPPAPPQVSVRRRPAKATRGRAKKAASASVDTSEADAAGEAAEGEQEARGTSRDTESGAKPEEATLASSATAGAVHTGKPGKTAPPVVAKKAPEKKAKETSPAKAATKSETHAAPTPTKAAKAVEKKTVAPAKEAAAKKPAPASVKPPVKAEAAKRPATSASNSVLTGKGVSGKAAPVKAAPVKAGSKAAVAKKGTAAPVSKGKPAPKGATKKAVATKHPVKKTATAKKTAVKAKAPAKRPAPAKAAKKAAKKSSRR